MQGKWSIVYIGRNKTWGILIYINYLQFALKMAKLKCALKIPAFSSSRSIGYINRVIKENLKVWFQSDKLSPNVLKIHGMHIRTTKRLHKMDNEMELVDDTKYFGVQVNRNLSWKQHVTNTCKKV